MAGNIRNNGKTAVVRPYNMGTHQGTEKKPRTIMITYKVHVNKAPIM
jgi:hypothetical protein